jgi:hypothetical protein
MQTHSAFGVLLDGDFPFRVRLAAGTGDPEVTITASSQRPRADPWESGKPIYTSPRRRPDGGSVCHLHRSKGCDVLCFPDLSDFYLWPDRIVCHLRGSQRRDLAELNLLGPVFAYWLERRACLVLHASAVALGRRAAAFTARHGVGKSGVAAALLAIGGALLSDDLLAVEMRGTEFLAHPSFPQMRMWPDVASSFLPRFARLPRVHPDLTKRWIPVGRDGLGTFRRDAAPLTSVYLLERVPDGDAPVEIHELSRRDAVIELLRCSFSPLLVEAAGLQPARLDLLSQLVVSVPVKRLRYPSGLDHLGRVASVVRRDLDAA